MDEKDFVFVNNPFSKTENKAFGDFIKKKKLRASLKKERKGNFPLS